jgi:carboxymethylenebutenolidase
VDQSFAELWERFRQGLLSRREFARKVLLLSGGAAAVGPLAGAAAAAQPVRDDISVEVEVGTYPSGDTDVEYYLAKPKEGGPFPALIVIHEIFGLTDFIRHVTHRFATIGFLAMAPVLLQPEARLPDRKHAAWMLDALRTGFARAPQNEIDELQDGFRFLASRPDVDPDHIGSVGFCWGGARSFTLATVIPDLWIAIVFYGSTPPVDDLNNIVAPVLGLYGALDNNSDTTPTAQAAETARNMAARNKVFEWEVYNMAPHGFFRDGNKISESRAAQIAWDLVLDFMDRYFN